MGEAAHETGLRAAAERERMIRAAQVWLMVGTAGLGAYHLARVAGLAGVETWPAMLAGFFAGALVADFVSGLVHWACDTWGSEETPIFGAFLIKGFREHHRTPASMHDHDWIDVNRQAAISSGAAFVLLLLPAAQAWVATRPFWYAGLVSFIGLSAVVNQLHKWAHSRRPPRPVAWLQRTRLVLSLARHARHHRAPHMDGYCIATGWSNPTLDAMGFWRGLERVVGWATGARPREAEARAPRSLARAGMNAEVGSRE